MHYYTRHGFQRSALTLLCIVAVFSQTGCGYLAAGAVGGAAGAAVAHEIEDDDDEDE